MFPQSHTAISTRRVNLDEAVWSRITHCPFFSLLLRALFFVLGSTLSWLCHQYGTVVALHCHMFLRALTHSEHLSVWHRSTRVGTHLHFIIMDELLCRAKHHKCSLYLFPIFRISSQIHQSELDARSLLFEKIRISNKTPCVNEIF